MARIGCGSCGFQPQLSISQEVEEAIKNRLTRLAVWQSWDAGPAVFNRRIAFVEVVEEAIKNRLTRFRCMARMGCGSCGFQPQNSICRGGGGSD